MPNLPAATLRVMWAIWAPVIGVVLVGLLTLLGQLLTSRNDRALTHQEVDLLAKLDPHSRPAKDLNSVIEARIARWHRKAYRRTAQGRDVQRLSTSFVLNLVQVVVFGLLFLWSLFYSVYTLLASK